MSNIKLPSKKTALLILTIIIGIIAVFPQTIYQPFLLQGDHGRDLYIFQQTANGAIPYRDYHTANGPLMPYYYGAFLSYLGENIQSVLLGYAILIFLAGFLIFLIARKSLSSGIACLCATWYWAWRGLEFFYTFNHAGAIVTGLATIFFTITSIELQRKRYFVFAFISAILCMMIRPDIGIAALFGLLVNSFIFQQKNYLPQRSFFVIMLSFLGGMIIMVNLFIPEIFSPYLQSIEVNLIFQNFALLGKLWFSLLIQNFFTSSLSLLIASISLIGIFRLWKTRSNENSQKSLRIIICLVIFFFLFLMEFLVGTRFFRWVWVFPALVLLIFHLFYYGLLALNSILRSFIYILLFTSCAILLFLPFNDINISRQHQSILNAGGSKVFMAPDQKEWINTITKTSLTIKQLTQPNEPILTLPYDAIYCFLAKRPLASNNPELFGVSGETLIPQIELQRIRVIVISNRAFRHNEEERFGILGKTYGEDLWTYIQQNYRIVTQIGPWDKPATTLYNHATRVYLRTTPFSFKKPIKKNRISENL